MTLLARGLWLPLLYGLTVFLPAWAAEPAGAPAEINAPFEHVTDYAKWVKAFEHEGREVYDRRADILAATGVKPGMAVADVGAGTGLYTRLFAHAVGPTGKVYAVDISRVFVDNILRTSREQGLTNVSGIVDTSTDTRLPRDAVDLVFVCDTYHHFEAPAETLRSIFRALHRGGSLVIVDFQRIEGKSSPWVMHHVRAGKEQVMREVEAGGFRLVEDRPLLRENFFLRFTRP
jgi:predicted methyltransferase